jgi:hypothetical protein
MTPSNASQVARVRAGFVVVADRLEGEPRYYTTGNRAALTGMVVLITGAADVAQVTVWQIEADKATRQVVFAGWALGGTGGELEAIKKAVNQ